MKELEKLTTEDILDMDYNNIISVVKETNRVPGGMLHCKKLRMLQGSRKVKNS